MTIKDNASQDEGFIRLTTDEVRDNLIDVIIRVMVEKKRIILHQAGEELAAIIPVREFELLEHFKQEMNPGLYQQDEDEYYADERGIHCLYLEDIQADFDNIIKQVRFDGEFFAFLPTKNLGGKKVDVCSPVAVVMPIENFWIPEYLFADKT
ncbi:MAG: type II toxin-antitoxin system Phd/YefM family antitoxin [Potamolinea sp.]